MWRHTPITQSLEGVRIWSSRAACAACWVLTQSWSLCLKISENNWQEQTKQNHAPPKIINQMNKIQIKAMKGWSRGRLFSYLCSKEELETNSTHEKTEIYKTWLHQGARLEFAFQRLSDASQLSCAIVLSLPSGNNSFPLIPAIYATN